MISDWRTELAIATYVRQVLSEVDTEHLWPYYLPESAASREQLAAAERSLGYKLDSNYSQFLLHANGWRAFYQKVDLFGVEDLLGGARMHCAVELVRALDSKALEASRVRRDELLPIAVAVEDIDLFVLGCPSSPISGQVIWFAGGEVDRYPSFDEFFLAMVDYNRQEIDELLEGNHA